MKNQWFERTKLSVSSWLLFAVLLGAFSKIKSLKSQTKKTKNWVTLSDLIIISNHISACSILGQCPGFSYQISTAKKYGQSLSPYKSNFAHILVYYQLLVEKSNLNSYFRLSYSWTFYKTDEKTCLLSPAHFGCLEQTEECVIYDVIPNRWILGVYSFHSALR